MYTYMYIYIYIYMYICIYVLYIYIYIYIYIERGWHGAAGRDQVGGVPERYNIHNVMLYDMKQYNMI